MYGDEALIEIEIESARQWTTRNGLAFDQLVRDYATVELQRIGTLISRLQEVSETDRDVVEAIMLWERRLTDHPMSVFVYRHEQATTRLRLQLAEMEAALTTRMDALRLVDSAILEACSPAGPRSPKELAQCVCSRVAGFEVVALVGGGYNAAVEAAAGHNLIVLHSGIDDLLHAAMHLIAAFGTEVDETGGRTTYRIHSLRDEPGRFAAALAKARELLDLARGTRYSIDLGIDRVDPAQEQLVHRLLKGALNFVCFHEFGHIVLTRLTEPNHQELLCDEFAARLVLASGDPLQTCGMYIALDFLQIVSMLDGIAGRSATHPPVKNRAKHFQLLIEENGAELDRAHDALLDISTRLKEEQVFVMETMDALRSRLSEALQHADSLPIPPASRRGVADAVASAAISLPKVDEDAIVTIQYEGGKRYRVVRFDIVAAIGAAAGAIASLVGATNPVVVGTSVLACLASLRSVVRPLSDAEGAIVYALYQKHPSPQRRAELDVALEGFLRDGSQTASDTAAALQALIGLGCVRQEDASYRLVERVLVRMPWSP